MILVALLASAETPQVIGSGPLPGNAAAFNSYANTKCKGPKRTTWAVACDTAADKKSIQDKCSEVGAPSSCAADFCRTMKPKGSAAMAFPATKAQCQGDCKHYKIMWKISAPISNPAFVLKLHGSAHSTKWIILPYIGGTCTENMQTDLWIPNLGTPKGADIQVDGGQLTGGGQTKVEKVAVIWIQLMPVGEDYMTTFGYKHSNRLATGGTAFARTADTEYKYYDLATPDPPVCKSVGTCPWSNEHFGYGNTHPSWRERQDMTWINAVRSNAVPFMTTYFPRLARIEGGEVAGHKGRRRKEHGHKKKGGKNKGGKKSGGKKSGGKKKKSVAGGMARCGVPLQNVPAYFSLRLGEGPRLKSYEYSAECKAGSGEAVHNTCAANVKAYHLFNNVWSTRSFAHIVHPCLAGQCDSSRRRKEHHHGGHKKSSGSGGKKKSSSHGSHAAMNKSKPKWFIQPHGKSTPEYVKGGPLSYITHGGGEGIGAIPFFDCGHFRPMMGYGGNKAQVKAGNGLKPGMQISTLTGVGRYPRASWTGPGDVNNYAAGTYDYWGHWNPYNEAHMLTYMPIPSGVHFRWGTGTIKQPARRGTPPNGTAIVRFQAQYFDGAKEPPKSFVVVVDNKAMPMKLEFGDKYRGTYMADIPMSQFSGCKSYYFRAVNSHGTFTLPQSGNLIYRTWGISGCKENFVKSSCNSDDCRSSCGFPGWECGQGKAPPRTSSGSSGGHNAVEAPAPAPSESSESNAPSTSESSESEAPSKSGTSSQGTSGTSSHASTQGQKSTGKSSHHHHGQKSTEKSSHHHHHHHHDHDKSSKKHHHHHHDHDDDHDHDHHHHHHHG